ICECSPAKSSEGAVRTRRTASSAAPDDSEKPNFWSSCAVATKSCVCASTPVVTRTRTRGGGAVLCNTIPRRPDAARHAIAFLGNEGKPGDLLKRVDHHMTHARGHRAL